MLGNRDKNWIVISEDPRPDNYIAILEMSNLNSLSSNITGEIFRNIEEAVNHAEVLRKRYRVHGLRLFYENGYSKMIRS